MIITFTGHRNFRENQDATEKHPEHLDINPYVHNWLRGIKVKYPQAEIRVGGAIGTDMIVAKHAIAMGLNVHLMLPCPIDQFSERWKPGIRKQLEQIAAEAAQVTVVCQEWHSRCYLRRDEKLVQGADIVIGFYDGRDHGGTLYTMTYAYRKGIPVYDGFDKQLWTPRKGRQPKYQSDADRPDEETIEYERSYLRQIFYTNEHIHGECERQITGKIDELGLTQYRFYLESDDFDPHGNVILERHEILGISDEFSTAYKVKQVLECDNKLAIDIATWLEVVDPELNLWDYWIQGLKYDRKHAAECLYELYEELCHEMPDDEDALEHPELYESLDKSASKYDDSEADPTYGWHRIDYDDWREHGKQAYEAKPIRQIHWDINPSEQALPILARIQRAKKWQISQLGAQLFKMQRGKINLNAELSESDWLCIWNCYQTRKQDIVTKLA